MIQNKMQVVEVDGKGTSKDEAISQALSKIKKTIFEESEQLIVRVEPLHIEIIDAAFMERKEKFLFVFLPRTKRTYTIRLRVEIDLKTLDSSIITWQQKKR